MSFSRYNPEDSVISAESVVRGLWNLNGDTSTISSFYTASGYTEYYLDVYSSNLTTGSDVQFDIQYGNLNGSGSVQINPNVPGNSPSRVVYGQYRNLVYGTETTNFSFDGITTANDIYIINISRARYKQSIQPGSLNLTLTNGSTIKLTDDSNTTNLTRFLGENRVYYLISGSNGNPYTASAATTYYGILLPDLGFIVLPASGALSSYITAPSQATSSAQNNHVKLYNSIVAGANFTLQSQETVSARYFFTRIKNSEFNYTGNPSITDTNGNLLFTTLINNPQTYITTVGMYNDNNELLAVAKLSKPLVKDFTKEALIRVKLDY
jgi:hypothetical protein